jgi:hypothetical protein
MALEQEMAIFKRELPSLLKSDSGRFALVSSVGVDSVWDSVDDALQAGYSKFGLEPFLVKEIVAHEIPKYCSRNVRCRS